MGLNVSPTTYKLCSFNCVYCHYGWTDVVTADASPELRDLPTPDAFSAALEEALQTNPKMDYITFSGNGEPTLHPHFEELVDIVRELKAKYRPEARLCVLSNSSMVDRDDVVRALAKIDVPIMKLDAGDPGVFGRMNRPCRGIDYAAIVEGLKAIGKATLQTLFAAGRFHNTGEAEIAEWIARVAEIKPVEAQIYSIDRPPADESLQKVPPEQLKQIAARAERETGVPVKIFFRPHPTQPPA